jgi:hypothetical protein
MTGPEHYAEAERLLPFGPTFDRLSCGSYIVAQQFVNQAENA